MLEQLPLKNMFVTPLNAGSNEKILKFLNFTLAILVCSEFHAPLFFRVGDTIDE